MTLTFAIYKACQMHPWAARWFRLGQIIVQTPRKVYSTDDSEAECPNDVQALGSTSWNINKKLAWVFWDWDCGHGEDVTQEQAIAEARTVRDYFNGACEIRLSKSGLGVHCAWQAPDESRPAEDGPKLAKAIAKKLNLRCDKAVLGRQARWLWVRDAKPNAFKLIEGIK